MWISPPQLDEIVNRTLLEDLGSGDVTTNATVSESTRAIATAVARGPVVVCGGEVFKRVFEKIEPSAVFTSHVADGQSVEKGKVIWKVEGTARALLLGERSALNLTQRMSGVAQMARRFVDAVAGTTARIVDTRKTTPGLRWLERYAVRCGGAHNHRDNLSSAILIKDNHIVAAGGISPAIARARAYAPHTTRIEVEVQTLDELNEALSAKADIIMVDNFNLDDMREAVKRAKGKAIIEASGGVNLTTVRAIAETGVDVISVGALTHSAPAADIALDLVLA